MILIAGLGNPGNEYLKTRHNIGFTVIDYFKEKNSFPDFTFNKKFNALISKKNDMILAKPQTFMNLSGLSIQAISRYYKVESITIIHDDIDLNFLDIRTKIGGGNAGHNGLKSIDNALGPNYRRVRIGVGRPIYDVSSYVLSNFSEKELEMIHDKIDSILKEIW